MEYHFCRLIGHWPRSNDCVVEASSFDDAFRMAAEKLETIHIRQYLPYRPASQSANVQGQDNKV